MLKEPRSHDTGRVLGQDSSFLPLGRVGIGKVRSNIVIVRVAVRV